LLVVRLIGLPEHSLGDIMKIVGVSRQTYLTYRDTMTEEGGDGLLVRE
jgi:ACT domain-containing protein